MKRLALAQSHDITASVTRAGVRVLRGRGRLEPDAGAGRSRRSIVTGRGRRAEETLVADAVLIATGGHPREIPDAQPDGERILNWTQVYDLEELPEELIVVGSGVTGAEFAGAYQALGLAGHARLRRGTGCCRARTRTRPPCWRTSSGAAA